MLALWFSILLCDIARCHISSKAIASAIYLGSLALVAYHCLKILGRFLFVLIGGDSGLAA
jgi:hypothetical protein